MNATPSIEVLEFRFHVLPMRTRFPFQYGIASMTDLPHLFVEATLRVDGKEATGLTSEGLPPKWFTKDPTTHFDEDLPEMTRVVRHAANTATGIGPMPNFFEFGWGLGQTQEAWAASEHVPGLLAHLGVALVERATLDGLCRATQCPVGELLRTNRIGARLSAVHPSLRDGDWDALFSSSPSTRPWVRHTVGLGDPLEATDVAQGARPDDSLPYTLKENIEAYGLRYFKIKLCGDLEKDRSRLARLAPLLARHVGPDLRFSLDGNEQFKDLNAFRAHWDELVAMPELKPLWAGLLYVEQPIHRDHALDPQLREAFRAWEDAPAVILDESDGNYASLPRGFELGYRGVSHKNCKGIVKSLANAALAKQANAVVSGEDLANVGPVALTQDTVMAATLGIEHMERNGHHYFAGLSMWPESIQQSVLQSHSDLYRSTPSGYPALSIEGGRIQIGSLLHAPFGYQNALDLSPFETLDHWLGRNPGSAGPA